MKIRLHEPFFFQGHLYKRGEVVTLPAGIPGPMRAVRRGADKIDYDPANGIDANHVPGKIEDVPLFDIIEK
jgi:hypothetical protein